MWTVIIAGIAGFLLYLIKGIRENWHKKKEHFENFMQVLLSLVCGGIVACCAAFLVLCASAVYSSEATDPPKKLVDMDGYQLIELSKDKFVYVSSNKYSYAILEEEAIRFKEVVADELTTVRIYEDEFYKGDYIGDEEPMVFFDQYTIGGTFFIDNFTFCNQLGKETQVSFYIPKGMVSIATVSVN
jgi:hypothetical protein